jgi:hypothetical protein
MVVSAVPTQPVSCIEFPDKAGKTGNFVEFTGNRGLLDVHLSSHYRVLGVEFPTHWNREFFEPNRELETPIRELR